MAGQSHGVWYGNQSSIKAAAREPVRIFEALAKPLSPPLCAFVLSPPHHYSSNNMGQFFSTCLSAINNDNTTKAPEAKGTYSDGWRSASQANTSYRTLTSQSSTTYPYGRSTVSSQYPKGNSNTTSSQTLGRTPSYYYDSDDDYPRYSAPVAQTPVRTYQPPVRTYQTSTPVHTYQTPVRTYQTPVRTYQASTPVRTYRGSSPDSDDDYGTTVYPRYSVPVAQTPSQKPGEYLVNPQILRYTQDSIRRTFRDGRSVDQTVADIRRGTLKAQDLPVMRVRSYNGAWYSLDNRRLYVLKKAGVSSVLVQNVTEDRRLDLEFSRKMTNFSGGLDVRVRRGAAAPITIADDDY